MTRRTACGAVFVASLCFVACTSKGDAHVASSGVAKTTVTTVPRVLADRLCHGGTPKRIGKLTDPALVEASGIVQSRAHPGVMWVHNDSGDTARVFAINKKGVTLRQYALQGAGAVDWEDIAIASGANGAPDTLYLGDIGDNNAVRDHIAVYAIPEPNPATDTTTATPQTDTLRYPDGAHNAEAMFVDPVSRDLFIVTKDFSGKSRVYRQRGGFHAGPATLTYVETIDLGAGQLVTAGDISRDGSAIALRTYNSVLVWDRAAGDDVGTALARIPCNAPAAIERQSEAISIDPDQRGYVTTSEGAGAPLFHVKG